MKKLNSKQLREMWLDYFKSKNHYLLPSSSLVPLNDESLLWINSGVATLKKYFEGKEVPPSKRLVSCQKSIRTNDIDNVGRTSRHHSFFEMLGNFSIGDYFSKEATIFAWEFLTSKKWLDMNPDKLYITVHEEDNETYNNWLNLGIKESHLFKLSKKTNFWDVGLGPCGPNTEIFFDRGEEYDQRGIELIKEDLENDRFIEIWNIVLSKFNNDGKNNYNDLPQKNIDTGAGFERILSILQNTPSNFETDLFLPIINKIQTYTNKYKYESNYFTNKELSQEQQEINYYFKSVADFTRTITIAMSDGALPSNAGRGYVLRKLLRKAIQNLSSLGIEENILSSLAKEVILSLKSVYPNLEKNQDMILRTLVSEENQFKNSLGKGIEYLTKNINKLINGDQIDIGFVFKLFETYGLPKEVIQEQLKKLNLPFDEEGFQKLFKEFQELSRGSKKGTKAMNKQEILFDNLQPTIFHAYDKLELSSVLIDKTIKNNYLLLVFEATPFYYESGGQVADQGTIDNKKVLDVQKNINNVIIHVLDKQFNETFIIGEEYRLSVTKDKRLNITNNHSAVHLTFAALEKLTKTELPQRGSKITSEYFRFDFFYSQKISLPLIWEAEVLINQWIQEDINSKIYITSQEEAKTNGAKFLDNIKYSDQVRVVDFPGIDISLCGGTHVSKTSSLEQLSITNLEYKGSGIYRLTGKTGKRNIENFFLDKKKEFQDEFTTKSEDIINEWLRYHQDFSKIQPNFEYSLNYKTFLEEEKEKLDSLELKSSKQISSLNLKLTDFFKTLLNSLKQQFNQSLIEVSKYLLSDEKKLYSFNDLSKSFFSIFSKAFISFETNPKSKTFALINNLTNEDISVVTFIINNDFVFNVKEHKEYLKENNIVGGGSRKYFQFRGEKAMILKFIEEKWEL